MGNVGYMPRFTLCPALKPSSFSSMQLYARKEIIHDEKKNIYYVQKIHPR